MNTESDLCSSNLDRIFNSILALFAPLIGCLLMLYIGFKFFKFHLSGESKNDYPKTTFAFLSITSMLYVTVSLEIVNFCYDFRTSAAALLKSTVAVLYCAHVVLLIVLLFLRLYHVFETSHYSLSKCSIGCFITFSALGFVLGGAYMYFFVTTEKGSEVRVILYFIGAVLIVVATLSVILLYIWKLFLVVRAHYLYRDERSIADLQKESLIRHCAKYAVLAVASVLTEFCFWSVGRLSSRSFLWFFLLYVNATANVLCYALGFGNADNSYRRMCGCFHVCCQAMCSKLVLLSIQGEGDAATMATIAGATSATSTGGTVSTCNCKAETQTQSEVEGTTVEVECRGDCREVDGLDLPCKSPSIEIVYSASNDCNEPTNCDEGDEPGIDVVYSDAAASPALPSDHSASKGSEGNEPAASSSPPSDQEQSVSPVAADAAVIA